MAKLTAPLLSFDARGKLANSLVFIGWKGIKTVRQYVIPANPQTAGQVIQRLRMSNSVDRWHDLNTLTKGDWNTWAGYEVKPMAGFNAMVKQCIASIINLSPPAVADDFATAPGDTLIDIDVTLLNIETGAEITSGANYKLRWGTDPRDLDGTEALTWNAGTSTFEASLVSLTNGVPIYMRAQEDSTSEWLSGLSVSTPTA